MERGDGSHRTNEHKKMCRDNKQIDKSPVWHTVSI